MHPPRTLTLLQDTVRIGQLGFIYACDNLSASEIQAVVEPIGSKPRIEAMHWRAIARELAHNDLAAALNHCKMDIRGPRTEASGKVRMALRYLAVADVTVNLWDFRQVLIYNNDRHDRFDTITELGVQKPTECFCNTLQNVAEAGTLAQRWLHQNHGYLNKICWEIIQECHAHLDTLRRWLPADSTLRGFLTDNPHESWFGKTPS